MKPLTQNIINTKGRMTTVTQPRNNLGQFQKPTTVIHSSVVTLNASNADCVVSHHYDTSTGFQTVSVFGKKVKLLNFINLGTVLTVQSKKDNYVVLRSI